MESLSGKKVLVVGGAGFIGSHLVDGLLAVGAKVSVVDDLSLGKLENLPKEIVAMNSWTRGNFLSDAVPFAKIDACDLMELSGFIKRISPEIVFNLAVLPLPQSLTQPRQNIDADVAIVNNLCYILWKGRFQRLIHFSSSEVYGTAQYEPMCEKHPLEASTPYAASKAAGDLICMSYVRTFGCNISIIRPFNNYGPRQNAGSYAGIIPLTINRILDGKAPVIFGDGHQTRDYIYVADTVRAAIMMAEMYPCKVKGEIINVASGHDVSILWLVQEIVSLMHGQGYTTKKIQHQASRPGDVMRHIANILKAKDVLGFEHRIGMKLGLDRTIAWYVSQKGR